MLLQFSVENYRSFKGRAVLSLEASVDKELNTNLTTIGKERVLNSIAVFGANAAGKSNLFRALTAALMTVRESNIRQINEPLARIEPFAFGKDYQSKPTSFEFVFLADGLKYVYGYSATRAEIVTEYLYVYRTAKVSTIFERTDSNKYRFTSGAIKRELTPIIERNADNKLFLATATAWNCECTRVPYLWLAESINTYSNDSQRLLRQVSSLYDNGDESLRAFTKRLLHEADINISDYKYKTEKLSGDELKQALPKEVRDIVSIDFGPAKEIRISAIHTIEEGDTAEQYELPLREESQGTQNLFMLSPILKRAFDTGETLCVDEFDASLHPLLVIYLMKLFNDPEINRQHAQLIVSAHAMELLSLDYLRRDQIYFVEKKRKTGESVLYSLDEYSPRKNEDVRKAYLRGRYGSVPDILEEAELWQ